MKIWITDYDDTGYSIWDQENNEYIKEGLSEYQLKKLIGKENYKRFQFGQQQFNVDLSKLNNI